MERVITSFSEPAAQVVFLDWPTPDPDHAQLAAVGVDGVIDRAPGSEPDSELADAVATAERLGRAVRVEHLPADPAPSGPVSRPFWADLIDGSGRTPATVSTAPETTVDLHQPAVETKPGGGADLIVVNLPPHRGGDRVVDLVALVAARQLRVGGILTVLTHCDWTSGELLDLTGAVVTAGQNADLLYLQHIVALHAPVRDGRFDVTNTSRRRQSDEDDALDARSRTSHRALVRGLPVPHHRIHSDVLVFAQPHDHQPPQRSAGEEVSRDGDLR